MNTTVKAAVVAALLAAATGCTTAGFDRLAAHPIAGTVSVPSRDGVAQSGSVECFPAAGFGDVVEGARVRVTDQSGTVLGSGVLGRAKQDGDDCVYRFAVSSLSHPAGTYQVQVADRDGVTVTAAEVRRSLTLVVG